jgi:putative ABC transport system substrate-binding protein
MRRRDFITPLGGTAAWPLNALVQKDSLPVIGFLSSLAPSDFNEVVPALRKGLEDIGLLKGATLQLNIAGPREITRDCQLCPPNSSSKRLQS